MTEANQPPSRPQPIGRNGGPHTGIIRRAPTGAIPVAPSPAIQPQHPTGHVPYGFGQPSGTVAIAAAAVTILSGWATAVVATDLIAGWWQTDRLFCVAIAFLTLVFAATTVSGVILLLRRQPLGRQLIPVGAGVALLTFGAVFIAGARLPGIVHLIPVLQIASAVLALHPATKRWLTTER